MNTACNIPCLDSRVKGISVCSFALLLLVYFNGKTIILVPKDGAHCNDDLVKRYIGEHNELPDGELKRHDSKTALKSDWVFQPSMCRLPLKGLTPKELSNCLLESKASKQPYIATYGDSNGKRYFKALLKLVSSALDCELLNKEHINKTTKRRDFGYFSTDDNTIHYLINQSDCWSCSSEKYKCTQQQSGRSLILEHIGGAYLQSHSLNVNITVLSSNKSRPMRHEFLDFLFDTYWNEKQPDVFFVFLPFNHICKRYNESNIRTSLLWFHAKVRSNLPESKVYWIPGFREFEEMKPTVHRNRKIDGHLPTENLKACNRLLVETFRDFFTGGNSLDFTVWDLMKASEGKGVWSTDGVHMQPLWYSKLVSTFIALHCNSL